MRLLFDQNFSPRLVRDLVDLHPDAVHVRSLGMERADDQALWEKAREAGFVIVSKDEDFHQRSLVLGHPPKVIWIRLGNCSTEDIVRLLRQRQHEIAAFGGDEMAAFMALG